MTVKPAVRNKTWAELVVGDSASIERSCSLQDLILFAHVSGNVNPLMLPSAEGSPEKTEPVAPSMWVGSLVSAVLGNLLPGPGTLYRSQDLRFLRRVHVGKLVALAAKLPPLKTAVVCPEDHNSLSGALLSARNRLIEPILVGDPGRIQAAAKALDADISPFSLVAVSDPHAAAARAVAMVLDGHANA